MIFIETTAEAAIERAEMPHQYIGIRIKVKSSGCNGLSYEMEWCSVAQEGDHIFQGAKDVYVYITHGVLSGDAIKRIKSSVIKNLVITDTIDNVHKTKSVKNIEVLPISGLMGEAIKRISNSTSVSDLFK